MTNDTTNAQTPAANPALARLAAFVGDWQWEASLAGKPMGRGPTTFAWQEGGAFLVEHAGAEQPEFPSSTVMSWKKSTDGMQWELDFDLIYTKVG